MSANIRMRTQYAFDAGRRKSATLAGGQGAGQHAEFIEHACTKRRTSPRTAFDAGKGLSQSCEHTIHFLHGRFARSSNERAAEFPKETGRASTMEVSICTGEVAQRSVERRTSSGASKPGVAAGARVIKSDHQPQLERCIQPGRRLPSPWSRERR